MELILDQLELGTEHTLVLTEKIFEHHQHREIQDFQKRISQKLLQKNKQLKDLFSSKYQELLDCSELVNGITKYTSQIVEISNDCSDVLHQLLHPSPQKQVLLHQSESRTTSAQELRTGLFRICNKISKAQGNGLQLVPFITAEIFAKQLLTVQAHRNIVNEYVFLLEQIQSTIARNIAQGKLPKDAIALLQNHNHSLRHAVVLDLLYFHIYRFPDDPVVHFFASLSAMPEQNQFDWFKLQLSIADELKQVTSLSSSFLNLNQKSILSLLKVKTFGQFQEFISRQEGQSLNIIDSIGSNASTLIRGCFDRILRKLVQGDSFNRYNLISLISSLFELVLQDREVCSTFERDNLQPSPLAQFQDEWTGFCSRRLQSIFDELVIDIPALSTYIKASESSELHCQRLWRKQVSEGLTTITSLLARPYQLKDLYGYDRCVALLQERFNSYLERVNDLRLKLFETELTGVDQRLCTLAKVTLIFNTLEDVWREKLKEHTIGEYIHLKSTDNGYLAQRLSQLFQEGHAKHHQIDYFVDLLEDILFHGGISPESNGNSLKGFAEQYVRCLQEAFSTDVLLQGDSLDIIQHCNILSLLNPDVYFAKFEQTLVKGSQNNQKGQKFLKRPNYQITHSEDNPNFIIFPSLLTQPIKKQDQVKVDQQGLQMWSQSKPAQASAKPGVIPQTAAEQQGQSKINRFGQALLSAKEKTTNLLYKQYQ